MYNAPNFNSNEFDQLLGGDTGLTKRTTSQAIALPTSGARKGVYATFPASTPKYNTNNGEESQETQARLLIPFPSPDTLKSFMASYNSYSSDVYRLAETLAVLSGRDKENYASFGYIDFLLTAAQESFEEKLQVHDVLGDNFVAYFFGQRPPIFVYQGVLLNTQQDDWRLAMLLIYQNITRGTQLARRNTTVTLSYDNIAITGAMVNMSQNLTAEMQMAAPFTFQMLVKRIDVYRTPGAIATQQSKLPYTVDPDTFSTEVFAAPAISIRETRLPINSTATRTQQSATDQEAEADRVVAPNTKVYGAPPAQQTLQSALTQFDNYGMSIPG